jgi:radical SAM superfamily enzyme YgiQ (UPF0313 family)
MNILLIVPPLSINFLKNKRDKLWEPLGVLYLGTMIKNICDFQILDAYSHDYSENHIIEQVEKINPDLIGFSINFSSLLNKSLKIAKKIKKEFNKKIILGGNIPTFLWKKLIEKNYIDYIFLHEAEHSFRKFIEKSLDGKDNYDDLDGFVYKKNGKIFCNPFKKYEEKLDNLPISDHKLLNDNELYEKSIITSRGCPYNCIYCSTKEMWGNKWRKRSAENILKEIIYLHDNFKASELVIVDDNFLIDKERFLKLTKMIEKRSIDISISFSTRLELIDEDVLIISKQANVKNIFLGIESGSDRVLKQLKRNYTQKDIFNKIDLCIKYGIIPVTSFMIGIPFENINDVKETFFVIKNINTYLVQIHICSPLIGTNLCKKPGSYKVKIDYTKLESCSIDNEPIMDTKHLNKDEIYELYLQGLGIIRDKAGEKWKYKQMETHFD